MSSRDYWGVGLRPHHYPNWHKKSIHPYLEVLSDNYVFQQGGPGLGHLKNILAKGPMLMHSVGLNIGGAFDLDKDFVEELAKLEKIVRPEVISDHLCFTQVPNASSFDLLPVIRTEWNLNRIAERISRVQDSLKRFFTIENVSTYVSYEQDELTEIEFLNELCKKTGCGILLDINNIYINAFNHKFNAWEEIEKVNPEYVRQYHLAGHTEGEEYLHDTHDQPVCNEVWELFARTWSRIGPRPAIIERDDADSRFNLLLEEMEYAIQLCDLTTKTQ